MSGYLSQASVVGNSGQIVMSVPEFGTQAVGSNMGAKVVRRNFSRWSIIFMTTMPSWKGPDRTRSRLPQIIDAKVQGVR